MLELLISPVREVHAISMDPSIGNFGQAEVVEADAANVVVGGPMEEEMGVPKAPRLQPLLGFLKPHRVGCVGDDVGADHSWQEGIGPVVV